MDEYRKRSTERTTASEDARRWVISKRYYAELNACRLVLRQKLVAVEQHPAEIFEAFSGSLFGGNVFHCNLGLGCCGRTTERSAVKLAENHLRRLFG